MSKTTLPETKKFLKTYGKQVVAEQKTRLRSFGKGGGNLEKSLYSEEFETSDEVGVNFYMDTAYGNFVDKGVEGYVTHKTKSGGKSIYKFKDKSGKHKPQKESKFIQSLFKWTKKVGLPKGAAFPIRRKIWERGIETTNFFTIPIARSEKRMIAGIEKNMGIDIENNLQTEINKN